VSFAAGTLGSLQQRSRFICIPFLFRRGNNLRLLVKGTWLRLQRA
jgi:hypothetical protein